MKNRECKPRRWLWFASGIIFTVMLTGATAYFVPILDCPACEPVEQDAPEVGEVLSLSCANCQAEQTLTVWEYLQEFPVVVNLPDIGTENEEAEKVDEEVKTEEQPETTPITEDKQ